MLTAGILTERVTVYNPVVTRGDYNEQAVEYVAGATVWARVLFQRGAMALDIGELWMARTVSVTMRDRRDVSDRSQLGWDGKRYRIESFNRSKSEGSITITATLLDEGNG